MGKKTNNTNSEKKSQGRQNAFSGVKLEWLDSKKEEYINSTDHRIFYTRVAELFIDSFGNNLAIEENPSEGVDPATLAPKDIEATLPQEQRESELQRQAKYFIALRKKLGNWYRHRYRPKNLNQTLINKLIDGLIANGRCRPPRKRSIRDVYYELFWEKKIKARFDAFWATVKDQKSESTQMSHRNTFIMEQWEKETKEVRDKVMAAITTHHETDVEIWKKRAEVEDTAEGYQEAWNLGANVLPGLADALAEWLGSCIMITAVCPKDGEIVMQSAQSNAEKGEVGRIMAEYNPNGWSTFQKMVIQYGSAYFSREECALRDLRGKDCPKLDDNPGSVEIVSGTNSEGQGGQVAPGGGNNQASNNQASNNQASNNNAIHSHDPIQQWSPSTQQPSNNGFLDELNAPLIAPYGVNFQAQGGYQAGWQPEFTFPAPHPYQSADAGINSNAFAHFQGSSAHHYSPTPSTTNLATSSFHSNGTQADSMSMLGQYASDPPTNSMTPNNNLSMPSMTPHMLGSTPSFNFSGLSTPAQAPDLPSSQAANPSSNVITSTQVITQSTLPAENNQHVLPSQPMGATAQNIIMSPQDVHQLQLTSQHAPPLQPHPLPSQPISDTAGNVTSQEIPQPQQSNVLGSVDNEVPPKRQRKRTAKAMAGDDPASLRPPKKSRTKSASARKGKENIPPSNSRAALQSGQHILE